MPILIRNYSFSTDLNSYPENRKLSPHQEEDVYALLDIKCPASEIAKYIFSKYGLEIKSQDVHNVARKRRQQLEKGGDENHRTRTLLTDILGKDIGATVKVLKNPNDEVQIIFIQSSLMKHNFRKYPTVLLMDATYNTNNKKMPVLTVMNIDGNKNGQVVCYGIMLNESAEAITQFLQVLVENNSICEENVKTVLIDKDFAEKRAIETVLPSADIISCKFHIRQAIDRHIKSYPVRDFDDINNIITKMLNCDTEEEYNALHGELQQFERFRLYFLNSWHSIRHHWAGYEVKNFTTFGTKTTNIVESHHSKMKPLVGKTTTIPTLIEKLLQLSVDKQQTALDTCSKRRLKQHLLSANASAPEIKHSVLDSFPPKPAKRICAELDKYATVAMTVNGNTISDRHHDFTVTESTCSCRLNAEEKLICAHMFAYRNENGLSMFSVEQDVDSQYNVAHYLDFNFNDNDTFIPSQPLTATLQTTNTHFTQPAKFHKAKEALHQICDVLSEESETAIFLDNLNLFQNILNAVQQRKRVHWFVRDSDFFYAGHGHESLEILTDHQSASSDAHPPSLSDEGHSPAPSDEGHPPTPSDEDHPPTPSDEDHPPTPSDEDQAPAPSDKDHQPGPSGVDHPPAPSDDIDAFILPVELKRPRGRPKNVTKKSQASKRRRVISDQQSQLTKQTVFNHILNDPGLSVLISNSFRINESMLKDEIDVVLDINKDSFAEYFNVSGWEKFCRLLKLK